MPLFSFSLDDYNVTWNDDTYSYLSYDISQAARLGLLRGTEPIRDSFSEKLDAVWEKVGLPPEPETTVQH